MTNAKRLVLVLFEDDAPVTSRGAPRIWHQGEDILTSYDS